MMVDRIAMGTILHRIGHGPTISVGFDYLHIGTRPLTGAAHRVRADD